MCSQGFALVYTKQHIQTSISQFLLGFVCFMSTGLKKKELLSKLRVLHGFQWILKAEFLGDFFRNLAGNRHIFPVPDYKKNIFFLYLIIKKTCVRVNGNIISVDCWICRGRKALRSCNSCSWTCSSPILIQDSAMGLPRAIRCMGKPKVEHPQPRLHHHHLLLRLLQ